MKLEQGQVASITGGASGIGLSLATALAERGLRVAVADVAQCALDAATERLGTLGEVVSRVTDVRDPAAVQAFAEAAVERFGRVDLVASVAGVAGGFGPLWEIPDEEWRWVMDVNYWGAVHTLRAFMPHLVRQEAGHVINVASLAGIASLGFSAAYNSSKAAVLSLSRTLRLELDAIAPAIGVTTVTPGRRPHAHP